MASQALRADATLDVTPPPVRVVAAARAGLFYNLGHAAGPAAFVEAMRPMRAARRVPLLLGGTAGYLHGDVTGSGPEARRPSARLETDQVPVLALVARARCRWRRASRLSRRAGAGMIVRAHHVSTR